MAAVLSQEWLDRRREVLGALPPKPGASVRIQHVVAGAPDGQVAYVEVFEDGRLTAASVGASDDVDITFNETYPDAVAIATGELDLHVGFMQGRVKAVGSIGSFMAVLPATQSEEHRDAVRQVAAETDA